MLTGKQRSYLKGLANELEATVYIGKNEISGNTLVEIDNYLTAHEMVKVKIQEGCLLDPKEAANDVAAKLGAEFVQAIGRRFVLYRQNPEKKQITLPK